MKKYKNIKNIKGKKEANRRRTRKINSKARKINRKTRKINRKTRKINRKTRKIKVNKKGGEQGKLNLSKMQYCTDIPDFRVKVGDTYSIRRLEALTHYLGSFQSLGGITDYMGAYHTFIDIKCKRDQPDSSPPVSPDSSPVSSPVSPPKPSSDHPTHCFFTIGLKMGPQRKGTELSSPDFSEGKCTHLYNKCIEQKKSTNECIKVCRGGNYVVATLDGKKHLRGTSVGETGQLNEDQVYIINWFLEKSTDGDRGKIATLPFRFAWSAGTCMSGEDDFNCQKFTDMFSTNPDKIKQRLEIEAKKEK